MKRPPTPKFENDSDLTEDPFAPAQAEDEDLWFLPGPVDDAERDPFAPPLPRGEGRLLYDVDAWVSAEATLAQPLAELAFLAGRLVERLRRAPGMVDRLAMGEAVELSWLAGDRVSADSLALWHHLCIGSAREDAQALGRADWALRRLIAGPGPLEDLRTFLGRHNPAEGEAGSPLSHRIADWQDAMAEVRGLHPITQAAFGFSLWPLAEPSQGSALEDHAPAQLLESAVAATRIAALIGGQGMRFLPLALDGGSALRLGGPVQARLSRWILGADQAARKALVQLDQVEDWVVRAEAATATMSGRTRQHLIAALLANPVLSAPMAEALTKSSRAAVQRNMTRFEDLGLIREITGQGRFRFWAVN
ncbi:helix-turn-helix domain-containing protein [Pseudorhodobacter sp.]|uniref:helix-turn-helix domain-containing protein n=1 Tax=Pseudorhodobacter sp. TaxID=1934400 RepID=UPI002648FFE4|nr:helix-turn-helix domain-containing protein [Pseudorhodobacter sp.]MDN5788059.1 hypothetical protein [Pseudorhodobacter sp.]